MSWKWNACDTWVNCYICCQPLDQPAPRPERHARRKLAGNACLAAGLTTLREPIPFKEWEANK